MGREGVDSMIRLRTPMAERFRRVLYGTWRILVGAVALGVVAGLWGLDLQALTVGPNAPVWAKTACDIIITLLLGWFIWRLIGAALYTEKRISDAAEDVDPSSVPAASRLDTLVPLFRNTLLAMLAAAVAMIALSSAGVDIAPLIASAGILGIAIGFGAQSLVRDIFAGVFFLVDDAFRVGEYIELDAETRGEVETISVRSMQIRHHRGPVITIPFDELKQIMNHNRDWVIYKMSFRMEPDTDPQKFKKLVKGVGREFLEHPEHGPKFLEPLKSQGVYYVDDDSALVMRVKFKCKPRAQFVLRREIYHRLRQVFAENDLNLARRKVEVVAGEGADLAEQAATYEALPPKSAAPV
ncbi:MAG: mechanosensitive ion channel family protein [Pseudomonadota bacterium]